MTRMMVWRSYIWRATSVCGCCRLYLACAQTGLETSARAAAAPIFCTNVLIMLPPKECPLSTDSQAFLKTARHGGALLVGHRNGRPTTSSSRPAKGKASHAPLNESKGNSAEQLPQGNPV